MTFFANAGVSWPKVEAELREAGTHALSGGADLWLLLSKIEGWETDNSAAPKEEEQIRERCVRQLVHAADTYASTIKTIGGDDLLPPLTADEITLAAVPFFFNAPDEWLFPGPVTTRGLYELLINMIRRLLERISEFDLKADRRKLTPQVFQAMRDWEVASSVARLIAVINLRRDDHSVTRAH